MADSRPRVGKVKDGKYRCKGQEFAISQHGFARDMEFQFLSQTEDEIWFVLEATEETKQKYLKSVFLLFLTRAQFLLPILLSLCRILTT